MQKLNENSSASKELTVQGGLTGTLECEEDNQLNLLDEEEMLYDSEVKYIKETDDVKVP